VGLVVTKRFKRKDRGEEEHKDKKKKEVGKQGGTNNSRRGRRGKKPGASSRKSLPHQGSHNISGKPGPNGGIMEKKERWPG